MDPTRASQLAKQWIPNAPLKHEEASKIGLTNQQARQIDSAPEDGELTRLELYEALLDDRLEVDEQGQITRVKTQVSFVDAPPMGPPLNEAGDLFPGYHSQAVRNPQTQPLQTKEQKTYTPPAGQSFDNFIDSLQTPDQVAAFGKPFGNTLYDYERANEGKGPGGTQSPRETYERMLAICRDIGQLQAFALQENGYNARQMGYKSQGVLHAVATYEGKNGEGFGLVEYGRNYSPEQIAAVLGRPALSHEEALLAVRPEAKLLNPYDLPAADRRGSIERLYYTTGHQLYNETLRLKHENQLQYNNQQGVVLETALSDHWGIKLTADTGNSPDPTAQGALSAAVGYQVGNNDHHLKLSAGVQYRPNEGHHSIGANQWESHQALVGGVHAEGQVTPFRLQLGENHQTWNTIRGDFTGALAFTEGEGSNGSGGTTAKGWSLDNGLSAGLSHANLRFSQHLGGRLSEHFSYRSELFVAPDIMAISYGYGTGGSGIYSNIGANASLHYNNGGFGAHIGGQVLAAQVNNLEATGVSTGLSYGTGPLRLQTDARLLDSPEGARLQTQQSVNLRLTESIDAFGFASQEQIYNSKYGHFSNDSGQSFGIGLRGRF